MISGIPIKQADIHHLRTPGFLIMHSHCPSPLLPPPTPKNKGMCLKNIQHEDIVIHLQGISLHFRAPHTHLSANDNTNITFIPFIKETEFN